MITILHGPDVTASRNELALFRQNSNLHDLRLLDARTSSIRDLTQALESSSMFVRHVTVILERFFSINKAGTKKLDQVLDIISSSRDDADVIIWEPKEINAKVLSKFPSTTTVRLFKLPTQLFTFLDSIGSNESSHWMKKLRELFVTEPPDMIFSFMAKRIRQLLIVKDGAVPEGLAGWQVSQLTRQARLFTIKQLRTLYTNMCSSEYENKTGQTPFDSGQLLTQVLLNIDRTP